MQKFGRNCVWGGVAGKERGWLGMGGAGGVRMSGVPCNANHNLPFFSIQGLESLIVQKFTCCVSSSVAVNLPIKVFTLAFSGTRLFDSCKLRGLSLMSLRVMVKFFRYVNGGAPLS